MNVPETSFDKAAVVVFAPTPTLTVTIEEVDGAPDIHLHAGGQGVWQARMVRTLGATVTFCAVLSGEVGHVIRHLLEDEGIRVAGVSGHASSSAYVHDRRGGERREIAASPGDRLSRHELDELHALVLTEGLAAGTVILSGAVRNDAVPVDVYRRLASDLKAGGCRVLVDLSGERLEAAIRGGPAVVKVSHHELVESGRARSDAPNDLIRGMRTLVDDGAQVVVLSRGSLPTLVLDGDRLEEVRTPEVQIVDERGAGDSMTGAIAAALAAGASLREALALGAGAGAANATRHGLGSGEARNILSLSERVEFVAYSSGSDERKAEKSSPDDLARRARVE